LRGRRGILTPCCFARVSRPNAKAAQKAAHGARGASGEVGAHGGHEVRGRRDGRGAGWTRPRAHGATWGFPGPVARDQRAGVLGGRGSSLTRTHARGPTERLAGAIKFVSYGCHPCHRNRNLLLRTGESVGHALHGAAACHVSPKPDLPGRSRLVSVPVTAGTRFATMILSQEELRAPCRRAIKLAELAVKPGLDREAGLRECVGRGVDRGPAEERWQASHETQTAPSACASPTAPASATCSASGG